MIRRALVVTALALLTFAGAASAVAGPAEQSDVPRALPAADADLLALELVAYGPSVLRPGMNLTATASVTNTSSVAVNNATMRLAITKKPLTSSAALQRFLDDPRTASTRLAAAAPLTGTSITVGGTATVLAPGSTSTSALSASPDDLELKDGTAGVYGVLISVTGTTGTLATRTAAVTWYDHAITPLHVAAIATASGDRDRVTQVANASDVDGVALALDPVTVTNPLQATALTSGRSLFALPSGNPDLTSLAHAGDTTLIDFAVSDAASNTAAVLQGLPWLATIPAADSPTVMFASLHGAAAGILDVANGATLDSAGPLVDVTAGDTTLPVLVPETQLSTLLATYRPGKPDAAARLVAEAALIAQQGDGVTPVVVSPGDNWQIAAYGTSRPLADLMAAPWVVPVSVQSVLDAAPAAIVAAPNRLGMDADMSEDLIKGLTGQFEDVTQLSLTAENPNAILMPGGRSVLAPLAVSLRTDPDARTATYQASRDAVNVMLGSIYVAEGSDVNLIAAKGNLPVTLHNDLDVDATVTVVMRSSSPNLVVGNMPVVTIPAGGDYTAHVSVTGVKSANVTATIALQNSEGDVVASPQTLHVRVRADWGNAMTAIFTVGLALLLIAGIIRTIRRGRRSSRMAPVAPSAPAKAGKGAGTVESEDADG